MVSEGRNPKKKVNVVLGDEYAKLFEQLVKETRMKKSEMVRVLIDMAASRVGLEPLNDIPKFLAPIS